QARDHQEIRDFTGRFHARGGRAHAEPEGEAQGRRAEVQGCARRVLRRRDRRRLSERARARMWATLERGAAERPGAPERARANKQQDELVPRASAAWPFWLPSADLTCRA